MQLEQGEPGLFPQPCFSHWIQPSQDHKCSTSQPLVFVAGTILCRVQEAGQKGKKKGGAGCHREWAPAGFGRRAGCLGVWATQKHVQNWEVVFVSRDFMGEVLFLGIELDHHAGEALEPHPS